LCLKGAGKIARVCNDDVAFSWWHVTYFLVV